MVTTNPSYRSNKLSSSNTNHYNHVWELAAQTPPWTSKTPPMKVSKLMGFSESRPVNYSLSTKWIKRQHLFLWMTLWWNGKRGLQEDFVYIIKHLEKLAPLIPQNPVSHFCRSTNHPSCWTSDPHSKPTLQDWGTNKGLLYSTSTLLSHIIWYTSINQKKFIYQ